MSDNNTLQKRHTNTNHIQIITENQSNNKSVIEKLRAYDWNQVSEDDSSSSEQAKEQMNKNKSNQKKSRSASKLEWETPISDSKSNEEFMTNLILKASNRNMVKEILREIV